MYIGLRIQPLGQLALLRCDLLQQPRLLFERALQVRLQSGHALLPVALYFILPRLEPRHHSASSALRGARASAARQL